MNITFITGVMGSGKSKSLIESFKKDTSKKISLAANLTEKTATEGYIESRDGQVIPATYLNPNENKTNALFLTLISANYDSIYIDEVQFLNFEMVDLILNLASIYDLDVYLYGISTDFLGEYFESSEALLDILPEEDVFNLECKCEMIGCHNKAEYNARISDGKILHSGEKFLSQKSKYMSLCSECYHKF